MPQYEKKDRYNTDDLIKIVKLLRAPDGCPWDRVQTHQTIRGNVLEEAYEVADAIDNNDDSALLEETGDLLLQVVFHAVMAEERHAFDYDDIADAICKKLLFRHPHVFGDVNAKDKQQALSTWESMKKKEKNQVTVSDTLNSVPKAFPSLLRASKVLKRAKKSDAVSVPLISEEELVNDILSLKDKPENAEQILGDVLLKIVSLARENDVDSEQALEKAVNGYISDFEKAETNLV